MHTSICIYVYTYAYMNKYIHTYKHIPGYNIYTCMNIYIYTNTFIHIWISIYVNISGNHNGPTTFAPLYLLIHLSFKTRSLMLTTLKWWGSSTSHFHWKIRMLIRTYLGAKSFVHYSFSCYIYFNVDIFKCIYICV